MTSTLTPPDTATPPTARRPAPRFPLTFRQRVSRFDVKASPYLYISPFFLLFAITGAFPLVYTLVVSLYDWQLLQGQGDFVGLGNFAAVLGDRMFWNSIGNTLSIFLISTIPQLAVALLLAAALDQSLRARTFWRMSVLLPYVVSPVAVALIFSSIFSDQEGLANNLLGLVGIAPIDWTNDRLASHIAIASMVNWRWTGYNALILLAAMQAVPRDLHESAALDGAGSFRRFVSITIPNIRPTLIFVIITATIGGLQIFAEPRLFDVSNAGGIGGSDRQFQTTVLYLWEMAFFRQNFGEAAAVAWLLFLLIVLIGLVNFAISRRIASVENRVASKRSRRRAARTADEIASTDPLLRTTGLGQKASDR
ncbi:cellobiose ABC transporter membrane protein [Rathayibacter oskolensis]|uniref:Cellobiose ABC transporter membrane protein n=1 Tax=Rathayibacter oskolensis TaxID=1891671 RepID=A0A1X7PEI2_9MICO|nr:sugar ABC transporter permease [Rathayibacter oskolensis]SMH48836.1 cellobiose ABC transporter membrane protein [Rathayibacter oskolensis]